MFTHSTAACDGSQASPGVEQDYERDEGEGCTPGWWYKAVNANPAWVSNDPLGPYATLEEAIDDARAGVAAGGC